MRELFSLRIAGIRIDVLSADPLIQGQISSVYRQFIAGPHESPGDALVEIVLETGDFPDTGEKKKIFDADRAWSIFSDRDGYLVEMKPPPLEEPLWVARFDRRFRNITIYCGRSSMHKGSEGLKVVNPLDYPLDQVLLIHVLSQKQGVLLHAAGMRMNDRVYIFAGRSGAGKSTISRLLLDHGVGEMLSDDRIIVRKTGGVFSAFGTPWPGDAGIAENKSGRLAGIFFLYHGAEDLLKGLAPAEALKHLLPVASIPWYDEVPMSDILSLCEDLVYAVPAYELHFRPDRTAPDLFKKFLASSPC